MSEILSQIWTSEVAGLFTGCIALLIVLYVLCIVWVARDAYHRGAPWQLWAIVSLIPAAGPIAYLMLRPPMAAIDHTEQELEIALKQRQLMKYGECAKCGCPVEEDFIVCPKCQTRLKNQCSRCGRALDPTWSICPYCATPVAGRAPRPQAGPQQRPRR